MIAGESTMKEVPRSLVELCQRDRERELLMPGFEVDQDDPVERFRDYVINARFWAPVGVTIP